jgi:predicted ArsR family transcriptional regulator
MPSSYEDLIYGLLSEGPMTANEVARRVGVTNKTALRALMRLALTRGDVRYRQSGRVHIFWRERA